MKHAPTLKVHVIEYKQLNAASVQKGSYHCSQVIHIQALCSHNATKAFLLRGTIGLIQMGLPIAVYHTPLTVQHTEAIPENQNRKTTIFTFRFQHFSFGIAQSILES